MKASVILTKMNIIPILHNIRSAHNVGSILRTCDGLGIDEVWTSGYTPYPATDSDERLPHVSKRATNQIAKTALGAQETVGIVHFDSVESLVSHAESLEIELVAIEQAKGSTALDKFKPLGSVGLIFGNEVDGLELDILEICNQIVEIPMKGTKESFNVSVVAGIVLYTVTT